MMGDNRGESDDSHLWDPSPESGSSARPSPPTGLPAESESSSPRRASGASAQRRRSYSAWIGSFGVRYVAGVDEAGRGSLAGPLVAAGVLFDLERIGRSERRALAWLNDSKQKSPEEREELLPAGAEGRLLQLGGGPLGARDRRATASMYRTWTRAGRLPALGTLRGNGPAR